MAHVEDIRDCSDGFFAEDVVELSCDVDFEGVLLPFLRRCRDAGVPRARLEAYVVW